MYIAVFDWWREHFGRAEDQPVIFALVLVLIAITSTSSFRRLPCSGGAQFCAAAKRALAY